MDETVDVLGEAQAAVPEAGVRDVRAYPVITTHHLGDSHDVRADLLAHHALDERQVRPTAEQRRGPTHTKATSAPAKASSRDRTKRSRPVKTCSVARS
jgi:hypothetical protein